MNLSRRIASSLAIAALLGFATVAAQAETVMSGTFTLPEQAYWGNTLLPAGGYILSVNKEVTGLNTVLVQGEGISTTFMAPARTADVSGKSLLKVDEVNGTYIIRELDAGLLGKSFQFPAGKAVRNMTLRGSTAQPATLPVNAGL